MPVRVRYMRDSKQINLFSPHLGLTISTSPVSSQSTFLIVSPAWSTELAKRKVCPTVSYLVEFSVDPNTLRVIITRAFKVGDVPFSPLTAICAAKATT